MQWISLRAAIGLLLVAACVFATASGGARQTAIASWPDWLSPMPAAQAAELDGESRLLFQVARQELIDERVNALRDEIRTKLRGARIGYTGLAAREGGAQVRISDAADVEKALAALADLVAPASSGTDGVGEISEVSFEEPEPALFKFTPTDAGIDRRVGLAVEESVEIINRRVYELDLATPVVQRQGVDRIRVEVVGRHDPEGLQVILATCARLTFRWVDQSMRVEEAINGRPPLDSSVLYSFGNPPVPYLVEDRVIVSGDNLVDAQPDVDQVTGEPVVNVRFDGEGTRLFGDATRQNIGRIMAVVLDEAVMSAPVVRESIVGGSVQISGDFSVQTVNVLALLLRTGAHPANLDLIEVRFTPAEQ